MTSDTAAARHEAKGESTLVTKKEWFFAAQNLKSTDNDRDFQKKKIKYSWPLISFSDRKKRVFWRMIPGGPCFHLGAQEIISEIKRYGTLRGSWLICLWLFVFLIRFTQQIFFSWSFKGWDVQTLGADRFSYWWGLEENQRSRCIKGRNKVWGREEKDK